MTDQSLLTEIRDTVVENRTIIRRLVNDLKEIREDQQKLYCNHNDLKRKFWILVGFLAGSGILAAGYLELIRNW